MSAYLLRFVLEVFFIFVKNIPKVKGVQAALCGMKCVNLKNETMKIIGAHFSHNKKS